jgi:hypothetical protein
MEWQTRRTQKYSDRAANNKLTERNYRTEYHFWQLLHTSTKKVVAEGEQCLDLMDGLADVKDLNSMEKGYLKRASAAFAFATVGANTEAAVVDIVEQAMEKANVDLEAIVLSAPPHEKQAAINAVAHAKRAWPALLCATVYDMKRKSLGERINQAREDVMLAAAREQLSSRHMNEAMVWMTD